MRSCRAFIHAALAVAVALPVFAQPRSAHSPDLALSGGTIYASPDAAPIREGVVLMHAAKIVAVGSRSSVKVPQVQILDCSDLFIAAGFWNSHVHFVQRKWANVQAIPSAELSQQMLDMITR
jgi:predicted amidohydrolase YtcJ